MFNLKVLAFLLVFQTSLAHEPIAGQGRMSFGAMSNRFIDSPSPIQTPSTFGGGITGEIDIGGRGGIEVSMFYYESQFVVQQSTNFLVEKSHHIYIPIGYRYWLTDKFSFGTNFYAAYRIGKWTEVYRSPGISTDAVTSAQDITEYGFDFAIGIDLFTADKFAVFLDSRYVMPTTDKPDENSRAYIFFLGYKQRVH
jgi:hypothetical protein